MKKKVGFFLPAPIADAYDKIAERVGEREKSQVISAAILLLLEATDNVRNEYITRVRLAGSPGKGYDRLITEALARSAAAEKCTPAEPTGDDVADYAVREPTDIEAKTPTTPDPDKGRGSRRNRRKRQPKRGQ